MDRVASRREIPIGRRVELILLQSEIMAALETNFDSSEFSTEIKVDRVGTWRLTTTINGVRVDTASYFRYPPKENDWTSEDPSIAGAVTWDIQTNEDCIFLQEWRPWETLADSSPVIIPLAMRILKEKILRIAG